MNLLFDFLTAHGRYGAGEYQRRVFMTLVNYLRKNHMDDVHLFALYDSTKEISYEDLREEILTTVIPIMYCDLHKQNLLEIITENKIDRLFIACGQRIGEYPEVADVRCDVVCVTHDMLYEEWYQNHLYEYWQLLLPSMQMGKVEKWKWMVYFRKNGPASRLARYILRMHRERILERPITYMRNVSTMLMENPQAKCIMVSEYSKNSMIYNYHISPEKIDVLYSPERIEIPIEPISNKLLKDIINSGVKYYLMVSCNRNSKNPIKAFKAFQHFAEMDTDAHFVMIGMPSHFGICSGRIHAVDFLSDSDLMWAMKECYALVYPSFFEGFGYPPLEAMKYGKPVICSNTTSLPEIFEDAPIYCSPLYESSIFMALTYLTDNNYKEYSERSIKQYDKIRKKQEKDLQKLIDLLIAPLS